MTREEMDFIGGMNMCDEISNEAYKKIMCHCEEQEPKTGHWIEEDMFDGDVAYRCSECDELFCLIDGTPTDNMYNYCPNCGSVMKGEIE